MFSYHSEVRSQRTEVSIVYARYRAQYKLPSNSILLGSDSNQISRSEEERLSSVLCLLISDACPLNSDF
jgi:hypothetical protein